jgi:DNA helicase-2/ATP-dependent DNA helicase PcrA
MQRRPKTFMECLSQFQAYDGRLGSHSSSDAALRFAMTIAKVMEARTVTGAMDLIEAHMAGLHRHYSKSEDDVFYKDPPFLYLGEYARRYDDRFLDFIDHVEHAIAQMTIHASDDDSIDADLTLPVHLMTALRAKGKEFESVVVLDANDGIWPIRFAESDAEIEQERRLFYVAITRAQKRLIILSVEQLAGHPVEPTPYIEEMSLSRGR